MVATALTGAGNVTEGFNNGGTTLTITAELPPHVAALIGDSRMGAMPR